MYQITIYATKNYFLVDALNEKIEMMKSAGLIDFWLDEFVDKGYLRVKIPKYPKVLTLTHLTGSFQVLIFGLLASLVAFLLEFLKRKLRREQT